MAKTQTTQPKFALIGAAIFMIFLILSISITASIIISRKPDYSKGITLTIPKGYSTIQVAKLLKEKNVIDSELMFRVLLKLDDKKLVIKQGQHQFYKNMEFDKLIEELSKSPYITNSVTIPEGFTAIQIARRLETKGINYNEFIKAINSKYNYPFLANNKEQNKLEGYLFPDTYDLGAKTNAKQAVKAMLEQFDKNFKPEYYERAKELKMSVNEVITLASIIEKEARVDSERSIVSAVFHNRLKSKTNNKLESCATINYILGYDGKTSLTIKDTRVESPYNTYIHDGLPPGPICSPGIASIKAALYPANVDYLYFVARGDGSHIFSKTFAEHIRAKNSVK